MGAQGVSLKGTENSLLLCRISGDNSIISLIGHKMKETDLFFS